MGDNGPSLKPIRKVLAGIFAGIPVATVVPVVLGMLGVNLPEPIVGLIGGGLVALITYLVRSAPGEAAPPAAAAPAHYTSPDPDA